MNFIKAALAILYVSTAGYGFLRLILKDKSPFSIVCWIPISFAIGFGLVAFWGKLIMLSRLHLSFWLLGLPFLPFFIYGFFRLNFMIKTEPLIKALKSIKLNEAFFILVIIFGIGSVFLMSVVFPMYYWDARAIWGMKANMLFGDGTIFSSNFLDADRIQPHFRYPLLYPLAMAFTYFTFGMIDDWAVMLLVGLFFPFLVSFLYEIIRIATGDQGKALMGSAVLAVLPVFYTMDGPAYSGYADTPLALFFLVSFGTLFLWRITNIRELFMAGCVLSCFLPLVKNEGIILLLLNLIWVGWPGDFSKWKKVLKDIGIFLVLAIIVILPWILLRSNIPNVQTVKYLERFNFTVITQNLGRIPAIAGFYLKGFLGIQPAMTGHKFLWGGLWVIFVLAVIQAFARRKWLEIRLFCLVILYCVLMGGMFIIYPYEPTAMVANFFRINLSITPLVILLVMMQCERRG
jgi:hypothetical protein